MKNRAFEKTRLHNWKESFLVFLQPRVIGMMFLGFSAGLPYLLIFSTLNTWLRIEDVSSTEIGFFAWVGLAFSVKLLWAPFADHFRFPIFGFLGRRRSWMLIGQIGCIIGLLGISYSNPSDGLIQIALFSLLVAFSSATQDIALDAYRIEAMDVEYQGAMSSVYIWGYRIGLLFAGAGALKLSVDYGWSFTYQIMAMLMCIGILTVLLCKEPENKDADNDIVNRKELPTNLTMIKKMYVNPFVEFFERSGWKAIYLLVFICIYKLSDIVMGNMANPFYIDMGFSPDEIADIAKLFGFVMTIFGAYIGGVLIMKIGLTRVLLLGAILVCSTNLLFALLAQVGHSLTFLKITIAADNFSVGIAATAFVAYLSSLVNMNYTASQYAIFSSFMTLPGKFASGFSGIIIDNYDYTIFFIYSAAMGIPAIVMVLILMRFQAKEAKETDPVVEII
ncbi:MFS transporter [Kiloniella spongiae]|uniref:MFS transporter n=1 Tax=Kiloniella spongiae TaxID=1489064 RepID=A0A0H2MW69_9PROT|nr:AmpG family muropeptide MFS transporter [Kiloniella spongiae]KLN60925.1 MFS transporter [Kiloniella spongiae]